MTGGRDDILAGIQTVITALNSKPDSIRCLHLAAESRNQRVRDIEMLAGDKGVRVQHAPRETLDRLAGLDRHQDVVAELHPDHELGEADLDRLLEGLEEAPLLLVLDGVQDPHNLGACLRTAEAAGVHAVVVPKDRAAGLTPVARKASAGASEIVPLIRVTNLARTLRVLKQRGIWLCGASDRAETSLYAQDLNGPLALVMGGEGKGLRRLTAETCDYQVAIPMRGRIESLNVSVATGICLFEIQRQRASG